MNKHCTPFWSGGHLKVTFYKGGIYFQQAEIKNKNSCNPTVNIFSWG